MIKKFFSYDGKLFELLNKTGEIIITNILFLLCCIPVVTIGSALTSFYYTMIKTVRRERGTVTKEFFGSMKRTLGKGVILTLILLFWTGALVFGRQYAVAAGGEKVNFPVVLYDVLLALTAATAVYLFPVLSRFEMKLSGMIKLAFVMSIRFLPYTILILAGSALLGYLVIYRLPIACILVLPGVWCYGITYLMERALRYYMPKAPEGEERWYDEK